MDRQCSSCGGFCKKSGCERENVQPELKPGEWEDYEENAHLYTAPPQRGWQGLTDEEIKAVRVACGNPLALHIEFARAIEAKLKEKNT